MVSMFKSYLWLGSASLSSQTCTHHGGDTDTDIIVYIEYQSVCPIVRIGYPPPENECVSPLGPKRGESNTRLACGVREWGDPVRMTGHRAWHSLYSGAGGHRN